MENGKWKMENKNRDVPCLIYCLNHLTQTNSSSQNTSEQSLSINPSISVLKTAESSLQQSLPAEGLGIDRITNHLLEEISPALNRASLSPNYYGFVTGGVSPAARVADTVVSFYDPNLQIHLPNETIATSIEDRALLLLLELFHLETEAWPCRVFTTGATSSNMLGLACGREYVINEAVKRRQMEKSVDSSDEISATVGNNGLLAACRAAGIENAQILTTMPHSSLKKAASVIGFGRSSVWDVGKLENPVAFNFSKLQAMLGLGFTASIVVVSCGEVNTGFFATHSFREFQALREICNHYGAWLHVDAAFGLFARLFDESAEFGSIARGAQGLELADSIAGDAHKLLNVPYDCGFFFCRHADLAQQIFQNPNAVYLNTDSIGPKTIQSPLNIGIENSRRFRGLPVYATLIAYGRRGYTEMLQRQVTLARRIASYLFDHELFDLLPGSLGHWLEIEQDIFIIVLFRAKDDAFNNSLVGRINSTSRIYVSGTMWLDHPATRIAVANWQAEPERDIKIVQSVIEDVVSDWQMSREGCGL